MQIDLRSDTVTQPTEEMLQAMITAPLGDDVLGDEPTVLDLERLAAARTGKEAAMFVPSGTMGNLCAVCAWTNPGEAVIIEEDAHIAFYEAAGSAVIGGVMFRSVASNGYMTPASIEERVTTASIHTPGTTLVCLENTHNRKGGAIIPLSVLAETRNVANRNGMKIHMDGARVFNAAVALGVDVQEITQHVDSVNFCLSKGLSAPVGSVLCGPSDMIARARNWRKRVGGGMRQAGVIAACGIVALQSMVDRLADDHRRSAALHAGISGLPGLSPMPAETNLLMIRTELPAQWWVEQLAQYNISFFSMGPKLIRLVLHRGITDAMVDVTLRAFETVAERALDR